MKKHSNTNKQPEKFTTTFNGTLKSLKSNTAINSLRNKKTVVKTAKNRKLSSTLWLQRQLNDIYIKKAKQEGYCSRAAYKLLEINQKFNLIKTKNKVIDLGAAPGGWTQVASKIVGNNGLIVAVDLLDLKVQTSNTIAIKGDFLQNSTLQQIIMSLQSKANIVLSDMAPNTTGSKDLDHIKILTLIEESFLFAERILLKGGSLVVKVFQGGLEQQLIEKIKSSFEEVKYFKPNASRKSSKEVYLVATNFVGN